MLLIHFTADDLAKTRVATAADPLWEIVLSRALLHERHPPLQFRPWLRQVRADPARYVRMRQGAGLLRILAPMGPYFPDFLTPSTAATGLAAGLEAIRSTPRQRIRHELERLSQHTRAPVPGWARSLADGDSELLGGICDALQAYHGAALAPDDARIRAAVDADRARRAREMLSGGVEGLLASLRPLMRWRPPVLEVNYDVDHTLHLQGRGLLLIPSFFCHGSPVSLADPSLPPVLVYPIDQELRWGAAPRAGSLEALLGSTRAGILDAVADGVTTSELAQRAGISAASASRHATVLRDAGLLRTQRHGPAVVHTRTPLGTALLEHGAPVTPGPERPAPAGRHRSSPVRPDQLRPGQPQPGQPQPGQPRPGQPQPGQKPQYT